jgi:hypothetical protein
MVSLFKPSHSFPNSSTSASFGRVRSRARAALTDGVIDALK